MAIPVGHSSTFATTVSDNVSGPPLTKNSSAPLALPAAAILAASVRRSRPPRFGPLLRLVVFDVPVLAGVDLRSLPWEERRGRLELLGSAFDVPFELSPVVEPSAALAEQMTDGRLEGLVVKDRRSPYRDGSRAGWFKVKDRSWYEREAWRFERR